MPAPAPARLRQPSHARARCLRDETRERDVPQSVYRFAPAQAFQPCSLAFTLSKFTLAAVPQVPPSVLRQFLGLTLPPVPDLLVMAREQNVRNRAPFPDRWSGVMGIFQQPVRKTLF